LSLSAFHFCIPDDRGYNEGMDPKLEDEWLMHMAAGTDPLTGFAALPRDVDEDGTEGQGVYHKPASRLTTFLVLLCLLMTAALFLL
jgi:hypothetical protein